MSERRKAYSALTFSTLAFTVCFAAWMMNGVLITYLVDNAVFSWDKVQMAWLIGIPVLTGSIMRLPAGILTDKYGGRIVYTLLLLLTAPGMFYLSFADSFIDFLIASLWFGLSGTSFAIGIAYTALWFKKEQQGTALGIFGAGNAGAALTSLGAPTLLSKLTNQDANIEGWRQLPRIYGAALIIMAIIFFVFTHSKTTEHGQEKTLLQRLAPLKKMRVWRFGLYYFLVFGGFVSLAQWLVPYYVNVYAMSIVTAGLLASVFSLPSGVVRALGGILSDKFGARSVMYWILGAIALCSFLLFFPRMDIESPGSGIMALKSGEVTAVSDREIRVGEDVYSLDSSTPRDIDDSETILLPVVESRHEPLVTVGEQVTRRQLLARGMTHIYFQANVWVFTILVFIIGISMGIGKAAVYKYIPEYFPNDVGVVGGMVGVVGGLGGFVSPIIFGYFLEAIGLWTVTWVFFFFIAMACLIWMTLVVRRISRKDSRIEGKDVSVSNAQAWVKQTVAE